MLIKLLLFNGTGCPNFNYREKEGRSGTTNPLQRVGVAKESRFITLRIKGKRDKTSLSVISVSFDTFKPPGSRVTDNID